MKPIKIQSPTTGFRSFHQGKDITKIISDWEYTRNFGSVPKRKKERISNEGYVTWDRE